MPFAARLATADDALPDRFTCRGNEPSWSLRVDGAQASYTTAEAPAGQALRGQLARAEWARPAFVVWRGTAAGEGVLVAFVSREACSDTMSDERFDYRARVSMPDGTARVGCCRAEAVPAAAPAPASSALASAAPTPMPAPAPAPAPAPGPAPALAPLPIPAAVPPVVTPLPAPAAGRVVGLATGDGTTCRSAGRGGTLAFDGRRVNFTCPTTVDGRRPVLLGSLEPTGPGAFRIARGALGHEGDRFVLRDEQPVAVRVTEIEILGQRLCVSPPQGPRIDLGRDRLTYSCGRDGVDQVALLGELEPVAGGLAITRAVVAQEERAFVVVSRERIVVAAP